MSDYGVIDAAWELLGTQDVSVGTDLNTGTTYAKTSKKEYFELQKYVNTTSYSQLLDLHACPRKLQLKKLGAASNFIGFNYDFVYGHSVGAGVQNLLVERNITKALFNAFLAWNGDFEGGIKKSSKFIWKAQLAVEKFWQVMVEHLEDWELVYLPSGQPAIELAFSLDCNNGYKHYGHIDAVLRNKRTDKIAVLELKTTGLYSVEEANYANSAQAIGYAIILDAIFPGLTDYEVVYGVYSSTEGEWTLMPFHKTTKQKAEWIKDLLLDHMLMAKYHELNFYPKRGESCYNFFRRCEYFGSCNLIPDTVMPRLEVETTAEAEAVDYALNLEDIINAQRERA